MTNLLDTEQAAAHIGFAPNSLEKMRTYGTGPKFVKIGRAVRYRPEDLAEYIDARVRTSTSEREAA